MIRTLLETSPSPISSQNQWLLIAAGVATLIYIVFVRPNRKPKKSRDPLESMQSGGNLSHQRSMEREMSNLLVEYEGMIRRMTAQLDTRAARLELLIADAEARIATLRAMAASPPKTNLPAVVSDANANSALAAMRADDDRSAKVQADEPDGDLAQEPQQLEEPVDRRHQEVYDLVDGGLTARQIAQQLGRPNGEIDLILALRGARP